MRCLFIELVSLEHFRIEQTQAKCECMQKTKRRFVRCSQNLAKSEIKARIPLSSPLQMAFWTLFVLMFSAVFSYFSVPLKTIAVQIYIGSLLAAIKCSGFNDFTYQSKHSKDVCYSIDLKCVHGMRILRWKWENSVALRSTNESCFVPMEAHVTKQNHEFKLSFLYSLYPGANGKHDVVDNAIFEHMIKCVGIP